MTAMMSYVKRVLRKIAYCLKNNPNLTKVYKYEYICVPKDITLGQKLKMADITA